MWLALSVFALLVLTLGRPRSRLRAGGVAAGAAAVLWAAAYVLTYVHEQPWAAKVLLTYGLTAGIVLMAALLAREAWPDRVYAPALAAAATALLPAVFRIGLVFHPDPLFALLALTAVLLTLRARRDGWRLDRGIWVGAALGCTALVRQSAPIIVIAVAAIVVLLGRRRAAGVRARGTRRNRSRGRFLVGVSGLSVRQPDRVEPRSARVHARSSATLVLRLVPVPGPRHPPLPGILSERAPAEVPCGAVERLVRCRPRLGEPVTRADRVLASSQSILGFGGDALVLGGLVGFGIPALRRAMRNSRATREDAVLAALTTLFLLGWAAYVVTLIRFPQADGDPIQAHYLLFLAPAAAIFAVCAGRWAWWRSRLTRACLVAWLALYLVSFVALIVTSFD